MLKTKDGYAKVIGTSYLGSSDYLLLSNGDSKAISSLSVNYATNAGNANTLDGVHLNGIFTAFLANGNATRLVIGGVTKDLTIPYASLSPFLYKNSTFNSTGLAGLQYYDGDMSNTTNNNSWSVPSSGWHLILHLPLSVSGYFTELSFPVNDVNGLAWRLRRSSSYYGWYRILDSNNYSSYVKKIGTSTVGSSSIPIYLNAGTPTLCSTTLGVSITGNAATATTLKTTRTLWGLSFNGSADVSGTLSGVAHILFSADNTYNIGSNSAASKYIYTYWLGAKSGLKLELGANNSNFGLGLCIDTNLNVGIGTNTPAYKLDVKGDIRATGQIIRNGSSLGWVNGRKGALLRETTSTGYHTLWSLKTTNGSWDFGEYNSSGWNNIPVLSYITDTNFNSGNNTTTYQIKFPLDSGTIALTKNIPTSLPANGGNADTVDGVHVKWTGAIAETEWLAAWENYNTIRCIAPANVSVGNADKVDGYHASSGNNKPWGTIPVITATGGYMDIGKHLEFHYDNTTGSDYSTILRCTGNYANIVNLPSKSGTLALTSDIPTSLKNPYSLTLLANGTTLATYDGSVSKIVNLTYDNVGAAAKNHTHNSLEPWASYIKGDSHSAALKSLFNENKTSIPRNKFISMLSSAYDNTSYYMGYFLYGYENNPYGGFFVAHYDAAYYIGISNGSFTLHRLAYSTDIPNSLKNPHALTISLNGTSQGPYDGSAAKNINITPSSIGAATSDHNHDNRYLKLTGGTMQLGEGLKFHADGNYFGTDSDARIISLLDGNDKICDGGLIIDERGTLNGKEYVTELLRIRHSEFKWKGSNILHSGNTYVSNNKGYINNTEITLVNNADTVDGVHVTWAGELTSTNHLVAWEANGSALRDINPANVTVGNSDKLDGYHAYQLFRDLGWWNSSETHNANNIKGNASVFAYTTHSNVPTTGVLTTFSGGNDAYNWQMAKSYSLRGLYIRQRNGDNSTWSNWLRLLDENDLVWDNIAGKPTSFTPSSHTHSWTSITDKLVAGNEFNIVNAGFKEEMWFNYLPINDRSKTATITGYHFGNGATGYTSIKASGFIKTGSSSSYVLLGDGGHQTISSLSVNHASSAGNADYIRSNALPTPANNTVKAYKDSLAKFFNDIHPNVGVGANVNVSESIISHWSNDSATFYNSSTYCFIKIGGAYAGATYGQFLLSSYNLSKVGIVGRNSSQWSKIKWLAYEDQIPTDNKQLANGAGYITSAGSCAYATSSGNADKVDGYHASNLVKFYLSPMASDASADSAKSWFVNTMPSASGAIVYNVPGSEKTIIAGKSSGEFGHMLQLNYDNKYLRILRYYNGSWKSTDWEKISAGYADSAGSVAWSNITDRPSSLKNPYSLNVFGVTYDGSSAKTVTASTFVSLLSEGTSTVTDGTMFITSWASDSGFADTSAVNVPYKRKASCLWNYIDSKVSSKYLPLAGGTMNGNARIGHGSGNLYIGNSGNDGWVYTQDIASQLGTDKWWIRESGSAHFGNVYICTKSDHITYDTSIIECYSDTLYLNYYSSRGVNLCNGGGTVQIGPYTTGDTGNNKLYVNGSEFINGASNVKDHVFANGFRHRSHNSNDSVLLAGGGYSQGVPVRYWAIYYMYIGNSSTDVTYTKRSGNYDFITSEAWESEGSARFDIRFPSGYNKNNTLIFGNGDHRTSSSWKTPVYVTITTSPQFGSESQIRVMISNDASLDVGFANIYFMCMG